MTRVCLFTFWSVFVCVASLHGGISRALASNYYASPEGGGSGVSESSPFRVADFFAVANAGDTLLLLDGHYMGDDAMIAPPENLSGSDGQPITIRALNDGRVDIDGEGARHPISLEGVDWWVVEGVNAHSAGGAGINHTVVSVSHSSHCALRRIVAWDATDGNSNIFGVHNGDYNLVEDCAGFGIARKIFSNSQGGNHTTFRRCWGRWEGSHVQGPKCTFTISYNSYDALLENCIATWNAERMRESYELTDYNGVGVGETFTNYEVQMATGLITHDGFDEGFSDVANARVLGSLAYLTADERYAGSFRVWFGPLSVSLKGVTLRDVITIVEPGAHDDIWPLYLQETGAPGSSSASNLTVIGAASMSVHSDWSTSGVYNATSCDAIIAGDGHVLDPTSGGVSGGATMMKRIVDGTVTGENLWPWPMNQRILEAMAAAGRTPVDVTRTAFGLCGGTMPAAYVPSDAGSADAGVDASIGPAIDGAVLADGGAHTSDAGAGATPLSDGCSCRVAGRHGASAFTAFAGLIVLGLYALRMRARGKVRT
ncbi:MAG: hypothetical protein IPK60_22250 [Sandaracinaceae bacterium]|nr:hypothetical protein [Sandaracinaceae bacterium]